MQAMLLDAIGADGRKGAGPNVEGDPRRLDAELSDARKQRLVEMQPGRRRCNCTWRTREDGLIALAVHRRRRALDIGRQRHGAARLEQGLEIAIEVEVEE